MLDILILIVGLALVVYGADFLVDGASAVARRAGVSEFVIGLTIVGFGTSCPELVVSLSGAIAGNADISIGNVVGSNIFNTLLILGLTALIAPVAVTQENKSRDIPITLGVTLVFLAAVLTGGSISRWEGIVFLALFAAYLYYCFKSDKPSDEDAPEAIKLPKALLLIVAGLAGLVFGGQIFVDSAVNIARSAGVSDKFIAVTLLAGGTSLPELATCVVAGLKHRSQLALGNILGSNIFNILLILGCSAVVTPLSGAGMDFVDLGVLALSAVALLLSALTGRKANLSRFEGAILLLIEAGYFTYLIASI